MLERSFGAPLNGDILLGSLILQTNYKTASKQIVNAQCLAAREQSTKRESQENVITESHALHYENWGRGKKSIERKNIFSGRETIESRKRNT